MSLATGRCAIEARGVSFTYRRGVRPALSDVDLQLGAGQWGLLVGPSGAGKSTLVRCLNRTIPRFYPGDLSGRLLVEGRDVAGLRVPEAARHVGVVFQDFETQIFSTTCLLEVAFAMESRCVPPERIRPRALELLARVGLAGFEERDPATLSGGEKQRLVIAAVLALEAPLLVLDEPASDLDPGGRAQIYRLIATLGTESVLLVEHDLEGLPASGPGLLLVDGAVARRWDDASPEAMVELAARLQEGGVRPPPIASLAAALKARRAARPAASPPLRIASLDPESLEASLRRGGWRLEAPRAQAGAGGPAAGPEVLRCERVTHVYGDGRPGRAALRDVDLTIREGEMVAIIGSNGSGKTTLARHLCGLQPPSSGRVLLKGQEVWRIPARARARGIGLVFQNPDHQIFASSVREEVAFGPTNIGLEPAEVDRRVGSALEVVGLAGAEAEDPFTLTKGQRQRLALASVLACEPSVIVMDEPTTGLDLLQQASIMDLLARLNRRGHTILIVTHALWLLADPIRRVLVLIEGRLAADGGPREVMTDERLMSAAGLRLPDLSRLSLLWDARLLTVQEWAEALVPPDAGAR